MKQKIPFSTYIRRPKRDFLLHLGMCALGAVLGASLLVAPPALCCAACLCRALCYLRYKFGRVLDPGPPFIILE